jgi:hypothetical protein
MQDAGCKMQDTGLRFVVLALLAGREDQSGDDFVEQLDTVVEHLGGQETTATVILAAGFAGRTQGDALEVGVFFAKAAPAPFFDICRTHAVNQLPGDHPAAWVLHHPVGVLPCQVGEQKRFRVDRKFQRGSLLMLSGTPASHSA